MIEVFLDASFTGASAGDTVLWNSAKPSRKNVTFGTDGFDTFANAIAAVDAGGTIWLAASSAAGPTTISKNCVVRGKDATLSVTAPIVVTATVRFRDLTIDSTGSTIATIITASGGGKVGLTHCAINGPATVALHATGTGSGIVANGCSFTGTIGTNLTQASEGAAANFTRTAMPVGGSSGRAGNHYRHAAVIEAPAEYRELSKGQKIVWVPVDQCYANIEPLRASEYMEARMAGADATHRIEVPGGLSINPAFRVVSREITYNLGPALQTDSRENRLAFTATERVN